MADTDFTRAEADRFWSRVSVASGDRCWPWTGPIARSGYGRHHIRGVNGYAHRLVGEFLVGPISKNMLIDHLCHNRACCNPFHLRVATPRENQHNRQGKGSGRYTSRFPGVSWHAPLGKWQARIWFNRRSRFIGRYATEGEAAAAYEVERLRLGVR